MSTKPRTIDNIGIDASSRYAKDKAFLDTSLVEESRFIPQKAQVSVLRPATPAEFDMYLLPNKPILWAAFPTPPQFFASATPLFTHQLIPSLGTNDKQQADLEKVEALEDSLGKPHKEKDQQQQQDDEKKRRLQQQEARIVLALLKMIHKLDRTLSTINARRNQYQKG